MAENLGSDQDPTQMFMNRLAEHGTAIAELAQGMGALVTIAALKLAADPQLAEKFGAVSTTREVYDVILAPPEKGEPLSPRWQLVEKLTKDTRDQVEAHADEILSVAIKTGLKRKGEQEDYSRIDVTRAEFLIEGGANKTSVVRRGVAEQAMHSLFGEKLSHKAIWQFGGNRVIKPKRADGTDNPEQMVIRGLANELLPEGPFTEFQANLATARADGYIIADDTEPHIEGVGRVVELVHPGSERPKLIQVRPTGPGLVGGFEAVSKLISLADKQFVIATNGQYRSKDELQAVSWAQQYGLEMFPAVSLGDEPGDQWVFRAEQFATPPRPAAAYVNEQALYGRQIDDYLHSA